MEHSLQEKLITTKDAAKISGYNPDYLARFVRSGEIKGRKIGNSWLVDRDAFVRFLENKKNSNAARTQEIATTRLKEYREFRQVAELQEKSAIRPTKFATTSFYSYTLAFSVSLIVLVSGAMLSRTSPVLSQVTDAAGEVVGQVFASANIASSTRLLHISDAKTKALETYAFFSNPEHMKRAGVTAYVTAGSKAYGAIGSAFSSYGSFIERTGEETFVLTETVGGKAMLALEKNQQLAAAATLSSLPDGVAWVATTLSDTLREVVDSTNRVFAFLFAPRSLENNVAVVPESAIVAPAPTATAPARTSVAATSTVPTRTASISQLSPSMQTVNTYPTYTTVVQGLSADFVTKSLDTLRADIMGNVASLIRPVAAQSVTNMTTIQQVSRIEDLSNLIVRNGSFRGGTFDAGTISNAVSITAGTATFTNLVAGAMSLGSTTITGLTALSNASSTNLSVTDNLWIGGNATTTSDGNFITNGSLTTGGLATFGSGFLSNASSTVTSGLFTMNGGASTTNLTASGTGYFSTIGIGTTTPGSLLSVEGVANFTTATSTFYGNGINLTSGCFAVGGICVGGGSGGVGSGIQGQLPFYNAAGTSLTATSSIFLAQNGYVGIGTLTPTAQMEIVATGPVVESLRLTNNNGTQGDTNYIGFYQNVVGEYAQIMGTAQSVTTGNLSFWTKNNSLEERMKIENNGNVGIGTTSPYALLSIGGNMVIGAATAGGTLGTLTIPALATPAGTFLAADASGVLIATTSPIASITADYPLTGLGTAASHLILAFGTTTSNTWDGTQTFTNAPTLATFSGLVGANNGATYATATTTLLAGSNISFSGGTPVVLGSSPVTLNVSSSGNVATSSSEIAGQLSYWTTTSGTPATLGGVATSSVVNGSGISLSGTAALVGTGGLTITNTGLLSLAHSYSTAQTGAITLATSTTAISNDWGITDSGGTFTFNLPTATASIRGLLTGADWTTFNAKQAALGFTPANQTTTISTTYPLQGGGDLSTNRTFSLAFGTTTSNTWDGTQTFTNAPTLATFSGLVGANAGITYEVSTSTLNIGGNAATVTTNANLSGDVSSVGNTTTIGANKVTLGMLAALAANSVIGNITGGVATPTAIATSSLFTWTGTGDVVRATSPTLITPILGYASSTQLTTTDSTYLATTGGNVGVGTAAPVYKLDVAGFINTDQYSGYRQGGQLLAYASSTNQDTIFGLGAGGQNATTSATVGYLTAVGYKALNANTTGAYNTAVGTNALLKLTSGNYNTTLGHEAAAGSIVTGSSNTAIGAYALSNLTSGSYNTAIGNSAMSLNPVTGSHNNALGYTALWKLFSGSYNNAFGYWAAGGDTVTGSHNNALGYQSIFSLSSGSYNNALGPNTLLGLSTGSYNTAIGNQALYNLSTGYDNIMIGHVANTGGNNITTGKNNIMLGYNAGIGTTTSSSNFLNIGNSFFGTMVATTTSTSLPTSFANVAFAIATSSFTGSTLTVQNASSGNNVASFFSNAGASLMTLLDSGDVGIGTTTPGSLLSIQGVANFTTATSTFYGDGINLTNGCFAVNGTCVGSGGGSGTVGSATLAGQLPFYNAAGTTLTATSSIFLAQSGNVGVGTTTPNWLLQVAGARPSFALSDTSAGANLKHWLFSSMGGSLYIGTSTDAYATSTPSVLTITNGGNLGIGTSSPFTTLGLVGTAHFKSTTNSADAFVVENASATSTFAVSTLDTSDNILSVASSTGASYFEITSGGYIGVGTSSPETTLTVVGAICAARSAGTQTTACGTTQGAIYANSSSLTGGYDVAEMYPTLDTSLVAGDVVSFDTAEPGAIARAASVNAPFLGIISTSPGLTLGDSTGLTRPLTLAGRVPTKVSAANGAIAAGDRLVLSTTTPGVAVKAVHSGQTIGVALASYSGSSNGSIEVFVSPQYWLAPGDITIDSATGYVGIGTTTPNRALSVAGDIGATAFVNTSTRNAKKNIDYATANSNKDRLEQLVRLKVATYRYTIEDQDNPLRLGLITEDTESIAPEVLSADRKGVDIYKLATFTLGGVQALAAKLDAQEVRLVSLEDRLTALESGAISSASGSPLSLSSSTLASALASFDILVKKGTAQFSSLVFRELVVSRDADGTSSAGSATVPSGDTAVTVQNSLVVPSTKVFITFNSEITGSWWVSDKTTGSFRVAFSAPQAGDVSFDYLLVQTEGETVTSTSSGQVTTPSSGPDTVAPVITLVGDNPLHLSVGGTFVEPGVTVIDNVDGTDPYSTFVNGIEQAADASTIDTTSQRTHIITYVATDAAGNMATAMRSVIVGNPDGTVSTSTGSEQATSDLASSTSSADTTAPEVTPVDADVPQADESQTVTDPDATAVASSTPVI